MIVHLLKDKYQNAVDRNTLNLLVKLSITHHSNRNTLVFCGKSNADISEAII